MSDPKRLSAREYEAMSLLCEGLTYQGIAERMGTTATTVRTQLHLAYQKLGVNRGTAAILRMQELGRMVRPEPEPEPEPDEPPLSEGWKAYLRAFDRLLLARDRDVPRVSAEMRYMLGAVCIDESLTVRPKGDPRQGQDLPLPNLEEYVAARRCNRVPERSRQAVQTDVEADPGADRERGALAA